MSSELEGRVLFANGRPAAGVQVRVFDRDAPGEGDDDLTESAGVSDAKGRFKVVYAPSRYLDMREVSVRLPRLPFNWTRETITRHIPDVTDLYRPYAHFRYIFNGRSREHTVALRPFKNEFRLPEATPIDYLPTVHGFKYTNRYPGYFIPFSVPAVPDIPSADNYYGLCGGMVAASLDFAIAGRQIPQQTRRPGRATPLHQYIYQRQNDSLGAFGDQVVRFARWMAYPDDTLHGTWRKTYDEFHENIKPQLDDRNPLPVGLVYTSAKDTLKIWTNHQVLAYSYTEHDVDTVDLHIYDPNFPRRDDVVIHFDRVEVGRQPAANGAGEAPVYGYKCEQRIGDDRLIRTRGVFAMPYVPVEPPADL